MVELKILKGEASIPEYKSNGSACFDLKASQSIVLKKKAVTQVPTGLKVEFPNDHVLLIFSRSGLASRGFIMANSVGVIDSDYRGEIKILLWNTTEEDFLISKDDRIAQGLLLKIDKTTFNVVSELSSTYRGEGGFGSTGLK
ncbi:Deoxyuridine 5'-triphosphate nucleotidohydrolase [uncultured archaeon]|nr:Deoxyuridine 5'-triphosphate nucleotidohydrolase [uncultured archaeon]